MEMNEVMIINHLKNLKKTAENLLGVNMQHLVTPSHGHKLAHCQLCYQVNEIVEEYNYIIPSINSFFSNIGVNLEMKEINKIQQSWDNIKEGSFASVDDYLTRISLKCSRILSVLENLATTTQETKNKFEDLKKELKELGKILPNNVMKNLYVALEEFELNRLLGTTLICGRLAIFHLDSIPGKEIDKQIEELKKIGLLTTRGSEENVLKANKKLRGLFAHDLNYFPSPSDTLSILGDTISIVKIVNQYKFIIDSQSKEKKV